MSLTLTIAGNQILWNGRPGKMWGIRVASASSSEAACRHLLVNLGDYLAHGVNAVTVFFQGSSAGFSDPFSPDGARIDEAHLDRMRRIVAACDARGMAVIVGIFYQGVFSAGEGVRSLREADAVRQAVRAVAGAFRGAGNVILNIANEQNSHGYAPWKDVFDFRDPAMIGELCRLVHETDPARLVGAGGYHDDSNVAIGLSPHVDILLFDTFSKDVDAGQDSGWHHDHFLASGVAKPMVNVEIFGAWTKQFVTSAGAAGLYPPDGKALHTREIDAAAARAGLSVFFHSNPWCQGPSIGQPLRYDLGGDGSEHSPGIRWWFEHVRAVTRGR
jgi:hypothetical protein